MTQFANKIGAYIRLIRPKHTVKNLLIFLPLVFSGGLFDGERVLSSIFAFVAFSLVASVVYVVNDIRDRELDRVHPRKKSRPIASGEIGVKSAYFFASILVAFAVLIQVVVDPSITGFLLLASYLLINVLYSFGLKNIPILDVVILSAGFLIRVFYGAEVIGVEVSQWLWLVILSFSLYLSLGKRRGEIKTGSANSRKVNKYYTKSFLDKNMYAFLTLTIVFYSLWTVEISERAPLLIWTVPLIIVIVMLYSFDIEKPGADGDPSSVLLGDKILVALALLYGLSVMGILYVT